MLRYAFELSDDPQKENVYNRLIRDIMSLADDVKEDIIRSNKLLQYYSTNTLTEASSDILVSDISKMTDHMILLNDMENGQNDLSVLYQSEEYASKMQALFQIIWHTDKLKDTHITLLNKISDNATITWYDKSVLVSGITLSLIRHFDSAKIGVLFRLYDAGENQVWQRALVGLILGLVFYDPRIVYYPEILQRLKALQGSGQVNKNIEIIIQQYAKARETEKITRKIQQESLP
jgi:hypothetical protein